MYSALIHIAFSPYLDNLTLSAQLVDSTGQVSGDPITDGFINLGAGHYLWNYTEFADNFRGGIKFMADNKLVAFRAIDPKDALVDIATKDDVTVTVNPTPVTVNPTPVTVEPTPVTLIAPTAQEITDVIFNRAGFASGSAWTVGKLTVRNKLYEDAIGHQITLAMGEDLSQASVIKLYVKKPNGNVVEWAATLNDTGQNLNYTTLDGDIDQAGIYYLQPYVEKGSVKEFKQTRSLTVYKRFEE